MAFTTGGPLLHADAVKYDTVTYKDVLAKNLGYGRCGNCAVQRQ